MKVAALEKSGNLPCQGRIKSIPTRGGNTVVKLTPMPKRAVPGETVPF
jgi:hypothetical protein